MHLGGSMESMVSEVGKKKSEGRTKKEIANEKTRKNDIVLNQMEIHSQTF